MHNVQDELLKRMCATYSIEAINIDSYLFLLPCKNKNAFATAMAKNEEDRPGAMLMHMPRIAKEMLVWVNDGKGRLLYGTNEIELVHKLLRTMNIIYWDANAKMQYVFKDNPLRNMSYEEACVFLDVNAI